MLRFLLCLIILVMPVSIHALEAPVWVEATGESAGSDYDPPKEVMERARNDAKRRAIEEGVGSFIRSHTVISAGQLAEDLTYARVRGRIEKVEILGEERDAKDPNIFRVRLRALVKPLLPKDGEGIQIKLDLSRSVLREGDEIKIHYQTNIDCYVHIFSIAADNSVTLLFPNTAYPHNQVKANVGQVFPPEGGTIKLLAMSLPELSGKQSKEKVKIIATRNREILLEKGFQEGIFQVYSARSTGLVGDLARKLNQLDLADWGESAVTYTIESTKGK